MKYKQEFQKENFNNIAALTFVVLTNSLSGGVLYIDRPFDYAGTLADGESLTNSVQWTGDTYLILWNEQGLEHSWLGDETGGAVEYQTSEYYDRFVDTPLDTTLTYKTYPEGSTFWFTALFRTDIEGQSATSQEFIFTAL